MKKELLIPVVWFSVSLLIALLLVSCGTGHVSCDAYGQNDIEHGDISEDEAS